MAQSVYNLAEKKILKEFKRLTKRRKKLIEVEFLRLLEENEARFVRRRYLDGEKDMELIAKEMGYTVRHLYNFRKEVLKKLYNFSQKNRSLRDLLWKKP